MDPKIEEMAKYNDYVANFDPKVYLETYFCKIEGHMFDLETDYPSALSGSRYFSVLDS
jgi:hypothetical protein